MTFTIRAARADDTEVIRAVERAAGQQFRGVGMPDVAEAEPMSAPELVEYARGGRSWVSVDGAGTVVGYVVADVVDAAAHVEQLAVEPAHQGRGVGRALVEEVTTWARAQGLSVLTLTTFSEVPWNRPLYERLGFRVLAEDEITPALRAVRDHEAELGLDPAIRVCMKRDV